MISDGEPFRGGTNGHNCHHSPDERPIGRPENLKRAMFCGGRAWLEKVYARGRKEKISTLTRLYPHVIDNENFEEHAEALREINVIFSTWGMPKFSASQLDRMPSLEAVFYAAGTVRSFASTLIDRDITVVSAWRANAVPVSEFALSQILLSMKGYFRRLRNARSLEGMRKPVEGPGNFGETVAILGAGAIGTRLIELLRDFALRVVVFDPFLDPERAERLGVEQVSLEEAFEEGLVVSNHLANVSETKRLLGGSLFQRMRPGATFINTGRGATVNEAELITVMHSRPDLTALLDVTFPEPPAQDSPLYQLPNVFLSGHMAGSIHDELVRMADYCIDDFIAMTKQLPLNHSVTKSMLETMA